MPGIGVFQRTFLPSATFQSVTAPCPSPLPDALSPRNAGHGRGAARTTALAGAGSAVLSDAAGTVGAGAAGPADAAATRCSVWVLLFWVRRMLSAGPPRPVNVIV